MLYLLIILLISLMLVFVGYNYVNNINKKNKNKIKPLQEGADETLEEVNGKVYQLIGRVKSLEEELIILEGKTNKALGTAEENEEEIEEGKEQVSDQIDDVNSAKKELEKVDLE